MNAIAVISWDGTSAVADLGTNLSTFSRVSAGVYDLTFTSSFGFNAYFIGVTPGYTLAGLGLIAAVTQQTASGCRVEFFRRSDGQLDDPARFRLLALE